MRWAALLLISLSVHIFTLNNVALTFTPAPPPKTPQLVFWGSLLKKEETRPPSFHPPLSTEEPLLKNFSHIEVTIPRSSLALPAFKKPIAQHDAERQTKKITSKVTFPLPPIGEQREEKTAPLPLDTGIVPYRPLRLQDMKND